MSIVFKDLNFGDLEKAHDELFLDPARFPGFISLEKAEYLRRIVFDNNQDQLLRRDFKKAGTPRFLQTLNGHVLNKIPEINKLYNDPDLLEALNVIVNYDIYFQNEDAQFEYRVVPYDDELDNIFATRLVREGDTHGFHFDYPCLGLIICLEAPPEGMGGEVEYKCIGPRGYPAGTEIFHMNIGDAYLMPTTDIEHRVRPLKESFNRSMLSFSYDWIMRNRDNQWVPYNERGIPKNQSVEGVFLEHQ